MLAHTIMIQLLLDIRTYITIIIVIIICILSTYQQALERQVDQHIVTLSLPIPAVSLK